MDKQQKYAEDKKRRKSEKGIFGLGRRRSSTGSEEETKGKRNGKSKGKVENNENQTDDNYQLAPNCDGNDAMLTGEDKKEDKKRYKSEKGIFGLGRRRSSSGSEEETQGKRSGKGKEKVENNENQTDDNYQLAPNCDGNDVMLTGAKSHDTADAAASFPRRRISFQGLFGKRGKKSGLTSIKETTTLALPTTETKPSRRFSHTQPLGTIEHQVSGSDTLASLAAEYKTTTSNLRAMNHLMSSWILPGQIMFVPDVTVTNEDGETQKSSTTEQTTTSYLTKDEKAAARRGRSTSDSTPTDSLAFLQRSYNIHPDPIPKVRHQSVVVGAPHPVVRTRRDRAQVDIRLDVVYATAQHYSYILQHPVDGALLMTSAAVRFESTRQQSRGRNNSNNNNERNNNNNNDNIEVIGNSRRRHAGYSLNIPIDSLLSVAIYCANADSTEAPCRSCFLTSESNDRLHLQPFSNYSSSLSGTAAIGRQSMTLAEQKERQLIDRIIENTVVESLSETVEDTSNSEISTADDQRSEESGNLPCEEDGNLQATIMSIVVLNNRQTTTSKVIESPSNSNLMGQTSTNRVEYGSASAEDEPLISNSVDDVTSSTIASQKGEHHSAETNDNASTENDTVCTNGNKCFENKPGQNENIPQTYSSKMVQEIKGIEIRDTSEIRTENVDQSITASQDNNDDVIADNVEEGCRIDVQNSYLCNERSITLGADALSMNACMKIRSESKTGTFEVTATKMQNPGDTDNKDHTTRNGVSLPNANDTETSATFKTAEATTTEATTAERLKYYICLLTTGRLLAYEGFRSRSTAGSSSSSTSRVRSRDGTRSPDRAISPTHRLPSPEGHRFPGGENSDAEVLSRLMSSGCGRTDCRVDSSAVTQHWFDVPADRISNVHDFFMRFTPAIFGKEIKFDKESSLGNDIPQTCTLDVVLKFGHYGKDGHAILPPMDTYVRFETDKTLYKSRAVYKSMSPCWDETFSVEELTRPTVVQVTLNQFKRTGKHSVIGQGQIQLNDLELNIPTDLKLELFKDQDAGDDTIRQSVGHIDLRCTLRLSSNSALSLDVAEQLDTLLPELSEKSSIMENHHIKRLVQVLPGSAQCRKWTLLYSSERHGYSLTTLYRCTMNDDRPTLLIIKNTTKEVFGVYLTTYFRCSSHTFYGSGETFLFTFHPEFQKFSWTGANNLIAIGDPEGLCVGSSGGARGLWLDSNLYRGRSERCDTFNNTPLSSSIDFIVSAVEIWMFI